jgi:hypothetical protein
MPRPADRQRPRRTVASGSPGDHRRDRLTDQPALSYPGRSHDGQQPWLTARDHLVEEVEHHAQLGFPADHRALQSWLVGRWSARQPDKAASPQLAAALVHEPYRLGELEAGTGDPAGPLGGHDGARLGKLVQASGRVQGHAGDLARVCAGPGRGDHLAGADADPDGHR